MRILQLQLSNITIKYQWKKVNIKIFSTQKMQLRVAPKTIEIMLKTELTIQTKGLPSLQQNTDQNVFLIKRTAILSEQRTAIFPACLQFLMINICSIHMPIWSSYLSKRSVCTYTGTDQQLVGFAYCSCLLEQARLVHQQLHKSWKQLPSHLNVSVKEGCLNFI